MLIAGVTEAELLSHFCLRFYNCTTSQHDGFISRIWTQVGQRVRKLEHHINGIMYNKVQVRRRLQSWQFEYPQRESYSNLDWSKLHIFDLAHHDHVLPLFSMFLASLRRGITENEVSSAFKARSTPSRNLFNISLMTGQRYFSQLPRFEASLPN